MNWDAAAPCSDWVGSAEALAVPMAILPARLSNQTRPRQLAGLKEES